MKQRELILSVMQANPGKWYLPQDFMRDPSCFVGYEASARLSELAKEHPTHIESEREGRQIRRRWVEVAFGAFKGWEMQIAYIGDGGRMHFCTELIKSEKTLSESAAVKIAEDTAAKYRLGRVVSLEKVYENPLF